MTSAELVNLFYLAKIADPTLTNAQALAQVKTRRQQAAKILRDTSDLREYEMSPAEIIKDDDQNTTDNAAAITDHDGVNNWLLNLAASPDGSPDRLLFSSLRHNTYESLLVAWNIAGKP